MISTQTIANPSFSGHESFTLRFGWLPKGIQGVLRDRNLFSQDDALVRLGVGKNMVRSIRHWGLASGFLEQTPVKTGRGTRIAPSSLGLFVFGPQGLDQYLEDPATLWLIHWQLASRSRGPTTWYWAFNEYPDAEFTREKLRASLRHFIDRAGWKRIADATLFRDVDCFIRTYTPSSRGKLEVFEESLDCPLTELGLISEVDGMGMFSFSRGERPSLAPAVFTYALLDFWGSAAPLSKTLTFDQVAYHPGSPGRVFKLSDTALAEYLDRLDTLTRGMITYGVTAGLRQLYRRRELPKDFALNMLRRHYDGGKP